MGLEEYMTEEELQELNLGRLAGGVARGVGAVAGGAVGMWDASKQGFAKGRAAVANNDSHHDQEENDTADWRDSEFGQSFGDARANTSGDTAALVDRVVKLIDKLPDRDRRLVIAKLQGNSGSGAVRREPTGADTWHNAQQTRPSSTGGRIEPTGTGLVHRAAPKPAATSAAGSSNPAAPNAKPAATSAAGSSNPAAPNAKPAATSAAGSSNPAAPNAKPAATSAAGNAKPAAPNSKPAAKPASAQTGTNPPQRNTNKQQSRKQGARRGGKMNESMRASREEIELFRDEIKNIGTIISMLNTIYNRAKAKDDRDSMLTVKQRIAAKTHERETLMRQLERRMTPEQFEQLKESLQLG
jgi:hypothetical protein